MVGLARAQVMWQQNREEVTTMSRTVGIDLGTTNWSGDRWKWAGAGLTGWRWRPDVAILVGLSDTGKLVVGREALRQYAAAPNRTVRSIKRWMGTDHKTTLRIEGTGSDKTRDFCLTKSQPWFCVPSSNGRSVLGRSHASGDYCSRLFHRCSATGNQDCWRDCGFRGAANY